MLIEGRLGQFRGLRGMGPVMLYEIGAFTAALIDLQAASIQVILPSGGELTCRLDR